jgi:hypothetical protein
VSKLKLSDSGEVMRQSSIHADSNNLPDGAFVFSQEEPGNPIEITDSIDQPSKKDLIERTQENPMTPID